MAKPKKRDLSDLVQEAIDDGADTAEEIHRAIADMPLRVLEDLDVFQPVVADVRKVQDSSIGALYDAIRRVNHEVTKLAGELLEQGRAARRVRSGAAKRAPAAPAKAAARPKRKSAPAHARA
jgi:hypothetical protein